MTNDRILFPDVAARLAAETRLSAELAEVCARQSERRVQPENDLSPFRQNLSEMTFEEPQDLDALIDWTITSLERGTVHMTHPGYFGLFNPAPTFPAECADRIAGAFNPQICLWSHAPVAVEIEAHVVEQVARRAGLPAGSGGHFTSGGSEANTTALICALTVADSGFATRGARVFAGQPRVYVSAESHLAWLKIAHLVGIGRDAVRLIATDGMGRLDTAALEQAIEADQAANDVPVMIAATAGTTNAGMVDPLEICASLSARFSLWYHVDAAWGGALIASPKHRSILSGLERADSITIDAHKWFATTMGAGMFLTCRKSVLSDVFTVSASYMPGGNAPDDLYVNSIQWSRRFVGLRLFLSLGAAGWRGYASHVEHSINLVGRLIGELTSRGWRHVNSSPVAVACFMPPDGGGPVQHYIDLVLASGHSWVSAAQFEGETVLRACVTNGRTTSASIDKLVAELT